MPNYGFFGDKPSSYEISNDVSVVLRGEEDMAVIAQAVDGMKEVSYLAAQFEDSNKKAHEGEALNDALASIARKKSAYEKALGITLAPLRVGEVAYQRVRQFAAPLAYDQGAPLSTAGSGSTSMARTSKSEYFASEDNSAASSGGFGELRYESSVRAEYLVQAR